MAFLYHTACPECGSRDNLAMYEGGSGFCFGCRYHVSPNTSPYLHVPIKETKTLVLPDDAGFNYSKPVVEWISKYGLSIEELIKNYVYYSPSREQLIFTWWEQRGFTSKLVLWQARNFSSYAKSKCYTQGDLQAVLPIYWSSAGERRLVVVEDPVSALKISRHAHSLACLGSDLSREKITRLAASYGPIRVWLDGNMFHKAQKMAQRFEMLGTPARATYTELDPKEYSEDEIVTYLTR